MIHFTVIILYEYVWCVCVCEMLLLKSVGADVLADYRFEEHALSPSVLTVSLLLQSKISFLRGGAIL